MDHDTDLPPNAVVLPETARPTLRDRASRWVPSRRTAVWAATALVPVLAVAVLGWFASRRGWTADTVGSWLGGLGTLLAVGAALLLAKREADRDEAREQDGRRAQAEKIAAWYGREIRRIDVGSGVATTPWHNVEAVWRVRIRNASDLPVFDVRPTVWVRDGKKATPVQLAESDNGVGGLFLHELAGEGIPAALVLPVLPPGETVELSTTAPDATAVSPGVDLLFRDNAGRWWMAAGGRLEERPEMAPEHLGED